MSIERRNLLRTTATGLVAGVAATGAAAGTVLAQTAGGPAPGSPTPGAQPIAAPPDAAPKGPPPVTRIVAHPAIDAAIQLRNENKLQPGDIKSVALKVHPLVLNLMGKTAWFKAGLHVEHVEAGLTLPGWMLAP